MNKRADFTKRIVKKEKQLSNTYQTWEEKIKADEEQKKSQALLEQAKQDEVKRTKGL